MQNISPLISEWFRAIVMLASGLFMLYLGKRISKSGVKTRNIVLVVAVSFSLAVIAAQFHLFSNLLGGATESIGGDAVVAAFVLLLLIGIIQSKIRKLLITSSIILAYIIILIIACSPLYWHYFGRPLYSNYPDKDGVVQQTTGITCAPASGSMLLNKYGFRVSEGLMAELSGTNIIAGTSKYSLVRAIEKATKLKAKAGYLSYQKAVKLNRPFVAYIFVTSIGGHAVFVESINQHYAIISDPLTNSTYKTSAIDFKKEWAGISIWILSKPIN